MFKKFLADEKGATAIEYGLICGFIALAIISSVSAVGTSINDKFGTLETEITNGG